MRIRKAATVLALCTAGMSLTGAGVALADLPAIDHQKTLETGLTQDECYSKTHDQKRIEEEGADDIGCFNKTAPADQPEWRLHAIWYKK